VSSVLHIVKNIAWVSFWALSTFELVEPSFTLFKVTPEIVLAANVHQTQLMVVVEIEELIDVFVKCIAISQGHYEIVELFSVETTIMVLIPVVAEVVSKPHGAILPVVGRVGIDTSQLGNPGGSFIWSNMAIKIHIHARSHLQRVPDGTISWTVTSIDRWTYTWASILELLEPAIAPLHVFPDREHLILTDSLWSVSVPFVGSPHELLGSLLIEVLWIENFVRHVVNQVQELHFIQTFLSLEIESFLSVICKPLGIIFPIRIWLQLFTTRRHATEHSRIFWAGPAITVHIHASLEELPADSWWAFRHHLS